LPVKFEGSFMLFDKTKPMDLGDLFSNIFKLLKETISRNIIIAAIFLIPAGLIMAYGMDALFSTIMETARFPSEYSDEFYQPDFAVVFEKLGIVFFSALVFSIGYLCALIGITRISWDAINGVKTTIGEAFRKIFSVIFLRSIGQGILLSLAAGGCYFFGFIILTIGIGTDIIFIKIIGVFAIIGGILLAIYLIFRWYFAFTAIVCEDKQVIESFSKSSFLVSRNWWRTFAIIILFSIIINFAISLITTPVAFIVLWDFISQYFKMIATGTFNENDPEFFFNIMKSFGFALGIIIIISSILDMLITPLFNTTYYFDLKIRKDDFTETVSPDNLNTSGFVIEQ
jgi:hypothetical protein